jgi:AmmeMemoRadiSam system protein B
MSIRTMSHADTFYPADHAEITRYFKTFEAAQPNDPTHTPRAVIVPHAGYIYSGFTAESAYRCFKNSHAKRAIVIGPSHRVAYLGMSVSRFESFETPLGALQMDWKYADQIISDFGLAFDPQMHHEHSTEVQMPFIKYFAPQLQVIEMVYGNFSPATLGGIINVLLNDEENLIVISTDLSHFYTLEQANQLDTICLNAIKNEDPALLHQGCEACGKIGVEGMLIAAKAHQLNVELLDYRTSADASGDRSNVVGYTSALFY